MTETGRKINLGWLRWLPGVIISLVAIYIIYRSVRWQDLGAAFQGVDYWALFICIPLFLIAMIFRTTQWWLISGKKASIGRMYLALNVGYFSNNILPFRVGEIVRSIFFGQASKTGTFYALSTVVIERVFDVGLAATLLFISIPQIIGASWASTTSYIAMGLVISALVFLYFLARNRERFKKWFDLKTEKNEFIQKHIRGRIDSLLDGLQALTDWKIFLSGLGLLAISWSISTVEYFIMLRSFIPQATFAWAMFSLGILALGVAIPSAPANIGVFEASIVAALAVVHVDPTVALAFAVLVHFYHFTINSLIGIVGILKEGKSLNYWFSTFLPKKVGVIKE
jgi:glycosyltransferase 2 family protein